MPPSDLPSASTDVPAAGKPGKFILLPGRVTALRSRYKGTVQLYLADTYLLQIQVVRLRENYLRFAYKDIRAVEICRTPRGAVYNAVFGVAGALFLLGAFLPDEPEAKYTLLGGTAVFLVLLVANLLRGATCRTIVQTATGKHALPTLVRVRPARRALEILTERVAAVQGTLDQATAARRMEEFRRDPSSRDARPTVAAGGAVLPVRPSGEPAAS